jgi:hypothetical protein
VADGTATEPVWTASVSGMTDLHEPTGGGPRLEFPEEPEELRDGLRDALLAGGDWRDGFADDICLGVWLWGRWRPALEPAGCSREEFVAIVESTRRELWLWLLGDRRWEQYVTGLAGRVVRRLPAAAG